MNCDRCGGQIPDGCSCLGQDLMGFLSDFRTAAAADAAPSRGTARVVPAAVTQRLDDSPGWDLSEPEQPPAPPFSEAPEDFPFPPPADLPYWETAPEPPGPRRFDVYGWAPPLVEYSAPQPPLPYWSPAPPIAYPPPAPYQVVGARGRRGRPPVWVIGAVVAAVGLVVGVGAVFVTRSKPSLNGLTADQVMQKMVSAAHQAGTAHVEITQSQGGLAVNGLMDISSRGGTMSLSVTGASGRLQAVAIGDSLYMNGSADLLGLMGFPAAIASHYSDQWVVIPTDDPQVRQMAEELQTNVVVDDLLNLAGPLSRLPESQGSKVSMTGKVPANRYNDGSGAGDAATLEVSNTAPFVPLSISYSDSDNGATVMTFSRWGEHVDLVAPPSPVPLPKGPSTSGGPSGQVT